MDVVALVRALGFGTEEFVVVGSASMALHGIIDPSEVHDIDITVNSDLYENLKAKGWHEEPSAWYDQPVLRKYPYDIGNIYGSWTFEELLENCSIVQGIPVVSAMLQLAWMRQVNRPKDNKKIKLLQDYLDQ